jgi:hypothetical protein
MSEGCQPKGPKLEPDDYLVVEEYGKPALLEIVKVLVKKDMLKSLAWHQNSLWHGYHDENRCRWCIFYYRPTYRRAHNKMDYQKIRNTKPPAPPITQK